MQSTTAFQNRLLPFDSVHLGRLICDIRSPEYEQSFIDPSGINPSEFTTTPWQDSQELLNSMKLREHLSQLLSTSTSNGSQCLDPTDHPAANGFTYLLRNPETWFNNACAMPVIRNWLECSADDGYDVYLVAGFHTLIDSRPRNGVTPEAEGDGEVSASAVILNTGVDSEAEAGNQHSSTACAPGEKIYAVLYHKVQFKWYSSQEVESGFLEQNNRWRVYWEFRCGADDDDGDDENVAEAYLEEETEPGRSDEIYIGADGRISL
ncbi:hypothetical protein Q9L58_008267 [Maublancomyces gigas]|uniref:Uncharacterized protein n=1 Tax=Discina gigas TaxID=1032678 RepID=A0ABR3GA56_9PEZI